MNRMVIIYTFIVINLIYILSKIIIGKRDNYLKTMKLRNYCTGVYLVILTILIVYVVTGNYDKMGNRRATDDMHYYTENQEEYIIKENQLINVKSKERVELDNCFVNAKGFLEIKKRDLQVVDSDEQLYKDKDGRKYMSVQWAQWDFFGYLIVNLL